MAKTLQDFFPPEMDALLASLTPSVGDYYATVDRVKGRWVFHKITGVNEKLVSAKDCGAFPVDSIFKTKRLNNGRAVWTNTTRKGSILVRRLEKGNNKLPENERF